MAISFTPADYTPMLSGYTGQGAFRFWCQKVLPIVYDDSLSYYELLNKVVVYLNNVISDVATCEENIGALGTSYGELQQFVNDNFDALTLAYNQLETFVDDYFNQLDVQEEINHKLDDMVVDGTFTNLIEPIVEVTAGAVITDWMNTHITPTSPVVDTSLSVSGAAADAKVTGDLFKICSKFMNVISNSETLLANIVAVGGYYLSPGGNAASGSDITQNYGFR